MGSADLKELETEASLPAARPFLRRVRIRGYKSIAFCDVTLEPLTVLVGRNGCGKSNFLDALAFMRDAVALNVTEAVRLHGGWSSVACRTTESPTIEFEIDATIGAEEPADVSGNGTVQHVQSTDVTYSLRIVGGSDIGPKIATEKLVAYAFNGQADVLLERESLVTDKAGSNRAAADKKFTKVRLSMPPNREIVITEVRSENSLIGLLNVQPYLGLADAIRKTVFLNPDPRAMRPTQGPISDTFLKENAATLPSVIRQFAQSSTSWFERAKRYVRYIVPEVADFNHVKYGESETIRFSMNSKVNGSPLEFDARSMSDGTLRAIACIIGVFQNIPPYGRPSLVGIEEPETSLHPAAMNGLVDALDEATLATQVIITTHSAELLDNPTLTPQNIRVVQMLDGKTYIGPVDETTVGIIRKKLNSLGGLERDNLLDADFDDLTRQQALEVAGSSSR